VKAGSRQENAVARIVERCLLSAASSFSIVVAVSAAVRLWHDGRQPAIAAGGSPREKIRGKSAAKKHRTL